MMRLLSTLGWNPNVVLYTLQKLKPEKAIVFYGYEDNDPNKDRVLDAKEMVKNEFPSVEMVRVKPFSMGDCITKMKPYLSEDSISNITGGTKLMSMALTLLSLHMNSYSVPLIYVYTRDENMEIMQVPLSISKMSINIRGTTRDLLEILVERDDWTTGKILRQEIKKREKERSGTRGKAAPGQPKKEKDDKNEISETVFHQAKKKLLQLNVIEQRKNGKELEFKAYPIARIFVKKNRE